MEENKIKSLIKVIKMFYKNSETFETRMNFMFQHENLMKFPSLLLLLISCVKIGFYSYYLVIFWLSIKKKLKIC